jgi:hypothetical protein
MYFIFNLEYMYAALSRGILHRLSTKSHAQQNSKYPSEISEAQWPHTLHISLNQEKSDGPVWADELQRLVFKYQMFRFSKPDVLDFTGYFSTTSFCGTSIKTFPSLLWRVLVPPMKYTHPKPL